MTVILRYVFPIYKQIISKHSCSDSSVIYNFVVKAVIISMQCCFANRPKMKLAQATTCIKRPPVNNDHNQLLPNYHLY